MVAFLDFSMFQSEHILIPFIFSLAIIFGALETTKIFKNKAVNFLISVALAFFTVSNVVFLDFVWSQLGIISVFFILIFFIIFIMKAFGVSGSREKSVDALIINGAILFVLLSVSYLYVGSFPSVPFLGGGQNLLLLIFVVFIIVIFWLAYKSGGPEGH